MTRRSSTNERPPDPVFFIDRNLGPTFAAVLRLGGVRIERYGDHFESPMVPDTEWLRFVGGQGWAAITQDQFRSRPEEQEALMLHGVKTIIFIGRASHTELGEIFLRHFRGIRQLIARIEEPFIARLYVRSDELRVSLTLSQWLERQSRRW